MKKETYVKYIVCIIAFNTHSETFGLFIQIRVLLQI